MLLNLRHSAGWVLLLGAVFLLSKSAHAARGDHVVIFSDVRIFDGVSDALTESRHVLVRGRVIERVQADPIVLGPEDTATIIEGNGRTLMPGLIDAHAHVMMQSISMGAAMRSDVSFLTLVAARAAEAMLMRGFTSVRDLGGSTFAVKRAIDEGLYIGPRIYPCGATISQTAGHGDFRQTIDLPRTIGAPPSYMERVGMTSVADGRPEVLLRTRENLMRGATQIKVMAGGGVASDFDPLDVTQYTLDEMRAAVEAAEAWGTYVTVHAYTPQAVRMAVEAGVKCIEHGQLLDEETLRLLRERDVWLCLQPFLDDEDANPYPEGSPNRAKQLEMVSGTDRAYRVAKELGVRVAFGTDTLFDPSRAKRQGKQLAKLQRWYTSAEVLRMATSTNGELLALSGKRNPYPGRLGVVQEGALADLLLVDGNPLEDLSLVADPERAFVVIMKDGTVYKDLLSH